MCKEEAHSKIGRKNSNFTGKRHIAVSCDRIASLFILIQTIGIVLWLLVAGTLSLVLQSAFIFFLVLSSISFYPSHRHCHLEHWICVHILSYFLATWFLYVSVVLLNFNANSEFLSFLLFNFISLTISFRLACNKSNVLSIHFYFICVRLDISEIQLRRDF